MNCPDYQKVRDEQRVFQDAKLHSVQKSLIDPGTGDPFQVFSSDLKILDASKGDQFLMKLA